MITTPRLSTRAIALTATIVFLLAFGVRLLSWHDTRDAAPRVQSVVAGDYQRTGELIREGGVSGFFSRSGPLADTNLLGHPPGYPIILAILHSVVGESNKVVQFFQITCDALAAVVIFLLAIQMLSMRAGVVAGVLVAFSPQFAWNSVLLLPDTLAVLPLLVAIYLLMLALKKPKLILFMSAGIFVGLSCWLRANALLLGPFVALTLLILLPAGLRVRHSLAFILGAVFIIAPLTLRNWIVFRSFIPVSLGAGQTMLEGIADYDSAHRFGIPDTDMGIMKMEADEFQRPDYYATLFAPDGIQRERLRLARGFGVVRDHPGWFAGVMVHRAGDMLRLERARIISATPPVTHDLKMDRLEPVWRLDPEHLIADATDKSSAVRLLLSSDRQSAEITSDGEKYGTQFKTSSVTVNQDHDYVLRIPVLVAEGRMSINVAGTHTGRLKAFELMEKAEVKDGEPLPRTLVALRFVSAGAEPVSFSFNNAAPASGKSVVNIGTAELFDLGPASFLWTRYPRSLVRSIQKLFITAVMLPLAILGLVVLVRRRAWTQLGLLLVVPIYYFCFQSMLHTEYRYVLAIHYFLFVLVSLAVVEIVASVVRLVPVPGEAGKGQ